MSRRTEPKFTLKMMKTTEPSAKSRSWVLATYQEARGVAAGGAVDRKLVIELNS